MNKNTSAFFFFTSSSSKQGLSYLEYTQAKTLLNTLKTCKLDAKRIKTENE